MEFAEGTGAHGVRIARTTGGTGRRARDGRAATAAAAATAGADAPCTPVAGAPRRRAADARLAARHRGRRGRS